MIYYSNTFTLTQEEKMIKRKQMFRINLLFLAACISIGYIFRLIISLTQTNSPLNSHFIIIAGGLVCLLAMQAMMMTPKIMIHGPSKAGLYLSFILLILGGLLLAFGATGSAKTSRVMEICFVALIPSVLAIITIIKNHRLIVPDGHLIIYQNEMYFPGQTVKFRYLDFDFKNLGGTLTVSTPIDGIEFSDVKGNLNFIKATVLLDYLKTNKDTILALNFPQLIDKIQTQLAEKIRTEAKGQTFGQFIKNGLELKDKNFEIEGVSLNWQGKLEIGNLNF